VILPEARIDLPFNFLHALTWIDFSQVAKVSDAPAELDHVVAAVRGGQPSPADAVREAICPYRGLDAFREEDAAFFFGRGSADDPQSTIGQLVRKVHQRPFVMVVGRSGSGKSSLVYAGLLPALRRARDRFWNVLTLRPGPEPLRALASAFNPRMDGVGAAEYAASIGREAEQLRSGDPDLLSHMIREALDRSEGKPDRLLFYIDQWEELYAQGPSPSVDKGQAARHAADVTRFIDLLLNASQSAPVSVVATLRADFYDPLISHQKIRALLPTQQVLLGAMTRAELESTIIEPAKMVGLTFDPPQLVSRILDDAGEDEGMLPLLEYALKETWGLREGNVITADSYARSGGVREAIRLTAERTFEDLSPDDKRAASRLFLRLVAPGEGQENTRARAVMPDEPTLRKIVDQFAGPRTRLLVTGSDRAARPTVEVAHDALIRTWPRLRERIDANREKLRARAAIVQANAVWEEHGRRQDLLLPPGFQLERARALALDPGDTTIDDIKEFIDEAAKRDRKRGRLRALTLLMLPVVAGLGFETWSKDRDYIYINSQRMIDLSWPNMTIWAGAYEEALVPKQTFQPCSYCPEMVVVGPGQFQMGSIKDDRERAALAFPRHTVTIGYRFAVSKYQITFADWDACYVRGGCDFLPGDQRWGRDRRPVINVSWFDAKQYADWLSKETGKSYTLLSEAEYEYAARAGSQTAYPWGNEIGRNNANCDGCGSLWDDRQTAPVGSFAPNAFGLYDMVGNVWAWVEDCWHDTYEGMPPTDGSSWTTKCLTDWRVARGGSFINFSTRPLSAARIGYSPQFSVPYVGFRIKRALIR
jgi:formylglycine-generating enzyme required for sulfatase activity